MNVLVVYDSVYGNTEQIAKAIAGAAPEGARAMRAAEVTNADLSAADVLIIGSPTQGGRTSPTMKEFLAKLTPESCKGVRCAAFDTRLSTRWVGIFGFAAAKIASTLKNAGATMIATPQAFYVTGNEGPLKEGELTRAAEWAKQILGAH